MIEFTFRLAELGDIEDIYKLSNDKLVRDNSIHPEDIGYKDHVNWFNQVLSDEKMIILVVEKDAQFVGQVKFDIDGHQAIISLSLVSSQRGRGVGSMIIRESVNYLKRTFTNVEKIIAYVKNENIASVRSFEKVDFIFSREDKIHGILLSRYEKTIQGSPA
jgi:UDP-2,4-diacetamido-2,4,6-trideoxy-beta-L-altropyranose hydrolase